MVKLIALKRLPFYAGKVIEAGEEFDAEDKDVFVLKTGGLAEEAPKPKRHYNRRDLTAEQ